MFQNSIQFGDSEAASVSIERAAPAARPNKRRADSLASPARPAAASGAASSAAASSGRAAPRSPPSSSKRSRSSRPSDVEVKQSDSDSDSATEPEEALADDHMQSALRTEEFADSQLFRVAKRLAHSERDDRAALSQASSSSRRGRSAPALLDEEQLNERQAQFRKRIGVDSHRFASAGILKTLRLQNFLCHENFTIHFNPHINFIYATNGAGKSAILAALPIVFGSRAVESSKAKSMANLVRWDAEKAKISVTIKNEGSDAFQHDKFGDSIEISRSWGRSSSQSKFKVRGDKFPPGKWEDVSASEVRSIAEWFNIQVTNPCVLLNQEQSKRFLAAQDDHSKYEFFLKATQLEAWWDRINEMRKVNESISEYKQAMKENLDSLEEKKEKLETQIQANTMVERLKREIEDKDAELAWSVLLFAEQERDRWAAACQNTEKKIDRLKNDSIPKLQAAEEEEKKKLSDVESRIDGLRSEYQQKLHEEQKFEAVMNEAEARMASKDKEKSNKEKAVARAQRAVDGKQKEIKALEADLAKENAPSEEKRQRAIADRNSELEDLIAQKALALNNKKTIEKSLDQLDEEHRSWLSAVQQARNRARLKEVDLKDMERAANSGSQELRKFGSAAPEIEAEINRARFPSGHAPIGPLGKFISVRSSVDRSWLPAIEQCLTGRLIRAYLCATHEDAEVLRKILARHYSDDRKFPQIAVQKWRENRVYDHRNQRGNFPASIRFVIDCVDIASSWAFNYIVDEAKIESAALMEHERDAFAAVRRYSNRETGKISSVFTLKGSKVQLKGQSISNQQMMRDEKLLSLNLSEEVARRKADFKIAEEEARRHEAGGAPIKENIAKLERELKACERELKDIANKTIEIEADLRELQSAVSASSIREELESAKEECARLELEQAEYEARVEEFQPTVDECTQKYELAKKNWENSSKQKDEIENQLGELQKQLEMQQDAVKASAMKIRVANEKLRAFEQELPGQQEEFAKHDTAAKCLAEEIAAKLRGGIERYPKPATMKHDPESLKAQLDHLKKTLEKKNAQIRQQFGIDHDEAIKRLDDIKVRIFVAQANLMDATEILDDLKEAVHSREKRWKKLRDRFAQRSSDIFNQYLGLGGKAGVIQTNFTNQTMRLIINTDSNSGAGATDRAEELSGGERSWATIAFVMSLGAVMECPFRALDEFDVFMDFQKRKQTIDTLLFSARMSKNRQFIFLTPLEVTQVPPGDDITIHRLEAPIRNQQRLPFRRRNDEEEEPDE